MSWRQPAGHENLRLLTYAEAASRLDPDGSVGITERSIRRLVEEGALPSIRLGRRPAVPEQALAMLIEQSVQSARQTADVEAYLEEDGRRSGSNSLRARRTRQTKEIMKRINAELARERG